MESNQKYKGSVAIIDSRPGYLRNAREELRDLEDVCLFTLDPEDSEKKLPKLLGKHAVIAYQKTSKCIDTLRKLEMNNIGIETKIIPYEFIHNVIPKIREQLLSLS